MSDGIGSPGDQVARGSDSILHAVKIEAMKSLPVAARLLLPSLIALGLTACGTGNEEPAPEAGTPAQDAVDHGHSHADGDADHSHEADAAPEEGTEKTGALFDGSRLDEAAWAHFGTGVHEGDAVAVADLLATPTDYVGEPMRVKGEVVSVCQAKGCWVRIGGEEQNLFVQFKDYGFFLPKDCAGKEVVLEGVTRVDETSVEMRKHLLEDAGKHDEAEQITEPLVEAKFTAHGVALAK